MTTNYDGMLPIKYNHYLDMLEWKRIAAEKDENRYHRLNPEDDDYSQEIWDALIKRNTVKRQLQEIVKSYRNGNRMRLYDDYDALNTPYNQRRKRA